jgi:hypothetical protein
MGPGNAEGSSRPPLVLSPQQRDVLVGTLLGDGCLAKHGHYHRLHVKHSLAQSELAEFKYDVFRDLISMSPHVFSQRLGEKSYPCVQFATRTSPVLSGWHARFYTGRVKTVPRDIAALLSPLAIAVWVMDDGAADYAGVTLQTHSFALADLRLLRSALGERYGLKTSERRNKGKTVIYGPAAEVSRLRGLVGPLMLDGLLYKLRPRRERTP